MNFVVGFGKMIAKMNQKENFMIRQDKFQVGDWVEFIDEDPYTGFDITGRHRQKYGPGPYLIEEVEELRSGYRRANHTQIVLISGMHYSGAWFKPLREDSESPMTSRLAGRLLNTDDRCP